MPAQRLKLLITSCLLLVTLLIPTTVFAQQDPSVPSQINWDAFHQTTFTGFTITHWLSCFGAGVKFGGKGCDNLVLAPDGSWINRITYNGEGGGALGATSGLMAQLSNTPPASGVQYVANVFRNDLHLVPTSYAQVTGSGAGVISPIQKVWAFSRNIAYAGFIIIFIVVGFMIMLRRRINPQTVVSIQTALPGLVIGLILVTFSYFIAGLIIDVGFLATQVLGILFLSQLGSAGTNSANAVNNLLNNQNVVSMFTNFVFSGNLLRDAFNIGNDISGIIYQSSTNRVILGILGVLAACLNPLVLVSVPLTGGASLLACAGIGAAGGGLGGGVIISALVYLVLLFGLLQAMFRLLFSLIGAYVSIVLNTIFGPILILASSLPGQGGLFSNWWRTLLANVLIFPAVFGLFLIIAAILGFSDPWFLNRGPGGSEPPVSQFNQALPLFGGSPVGFIQVLLAYGMLLISPGIPDMIRDAFRATPNRRIEAAQQQGVRGGVGVTAAGVGLGRAAWTAIRPPRP